MPWHRGHLNRDGHKYKKAHESISPTLQPDLTSALYQFTGLIGGSNQLIKQVIPLIHPPPRVSYYLKYGQGMFILCFNGSSKSQQLCLTTMQKRPARNLNDQEKIIQSADSEFLTRTILGKIFTLVSYFPFALYMQMLATTSPRKHLFFSIYIVNNVLK